MTVQITYPRVGCKTITMKGYVTASSLSGSLGLSDRKIKEVARKAKVDYFTAKGEYFIKQTHLPKMERVLVAGAKKKQRGAQKGAKTRKDNAAKKKA